MRAVTSSVLICAIALVGCGGNNTDAGAPDRALGKFEPADGEVILFVGQELDAIGGLEEYNDGYLDHFEAPGGFTMYTALTPGNEMFGQTNAGLDGVYTTDNWGDGDSNMSLQLADPDFENMALAIGLWLVDHEDKVADGERDDLIARLGEFLLSLGDRPVFLRIGYEFDGIGWNHYEIEPYKRAFRRIRDRLEAQGVTNVAYVWQSTGWVSNFDHLEMWYPGDEYVDWCGFSFFSRWDEQKMVEFARMKGKPVFIAEATPTISSYTVKFDGVTQETLLSNPQQAEEAWQKWFVPFFDTVNENPDVVKAVSYINANWKSRPMWRDNPTFRNIDARLHLSEVVSERWTEETGRAKYLKASPDLFGHLWGR
ncbi:MAG: endo-1,3-beta-xylanase [Rhodothermales bacterium]|nr:endo-1,3-beta-xylanase [Rhodothermales bacterium]